jgi:hypothetical protein
MTLADEVKAVQRSHPGWTFQESWSFLERSRPELFVQSSAERNRITAKAAPQKQEAARERFSKVESIARHLMQKNSKLTFGCALEIARTCLPGVQAEIKELLRHGTDGKPKAESTGRVEADNDHLAHPGLAAAQAKGLLLVEGGFCTPILPKR